MGGYFSYLMRRAGVSEGEESLFCFFPKIKIWQESVGGQFSSIAHVQLLPLSFFIVQTFHGLVSHIFIS